MGSKGGTPPSPTAPAPPTTRCPPANREVNSVFSRKLCNPPFPNNLPTIRPPRPTHPHRPVRAGDYWVRVGDYLVRAGGIRDTIPPWTPPAPPAPPQPRPQIARYAAHQGVTALQLVAMTVRAPSGCGATHTHGDGPMVAPRPPVSPESQTPPRPEHVRYQGASACVSCAAIIRPSIAGRVKRIGARFPPASHHPRPSQRFGPRGNRFRPRRPRRESRPRRPSLDPPSRTPPWS